MLDDEWLLFVHPHGVCEIDVTKITGWPSGNNVAVYRVNDIGDVRDKICVVNPDAIARFRSTEQSWRFALLRGSTHENTATLESGPPVETK